ncbi:MAG: hypothetical protein D6770_03700, partial [Anaerolineae bacterium]
KILPFRGRSSHVWGPCAVAEPQEVRIREAAISTLIVHALIALLLPRRVSEGRALVAFEMENGDDVGRC